MEKKLKSSKGLMNWFLTLINTDLEGLSTPKLHEFWDQLREIAYGSLGPFVVTDEQIIQWDESTKRLIAIQETLSSNLKKILNKYESKPKKRLKAVKNFEQYEKAAAEYGDGMVTLLGVLSGKVVPEWAREHVAFEYSHKTMLVVGDKVLPYMPELEDRVIEKFLNALGEFPLSAIKRCQRDDCQNYFLEATKKEKRYCSVNCAWILASRERREKAKK